MRSPLCILASDKIACVSIPILTRSPWAFHKDLAFDCQQRHACLHRMSVRLLSTLLPVRINSRKTNQKHRICSCQSRIGSHGEQTIFSVLPDCVMFRSNMTMEASSITNCLLWWCVHLFITDWCFFNTDTAVRRIQKNLKTVPCVVQY